MNFYNPTEQPARIRFLHGASVMQPVDILIDERPIIRGLSYRQMTQFIPLTQGKHNIRVLVTGTNNLLVSKNVDISGSKLITLSQDGDNKLILVITDDMGLPEPMMPEGQPSLFGVGPQYQPEMMPQGQFGVGPQYQPGMMPQGQFGVGPQYQPEMMPQGQFGVGPQYQPEMMPQGQFGVGPQYQPEMMPQGQSGVGPQYQPGMMPQYGIRPPFRPGMGCVCYGQCPFIPEQQYQQMPVQQTENRDKAIPASAMIRFLHLSPNAPAVDITLPNGTVLFRNVPYKGVTDYIEVAPGTYTLQVRLAGTDQVVLTLPNVVISPNDMKSFHAIGLVNGTPGLEVLVLSEGTL